MGRYVCTYYVPSTVRENTVPDVLKKLSQSICCSFYSNDFFLLKLGDCVSHSPSPIWPIGPPLPLWHRNKRYSIGSIVNSIVIALYGDRS